MVPEHSNHRALRRCAIHIAYLNPLDEEQKGEQGVISIDVILEQHQVQRRIHLRSGGPPIGTVPRLHDACGQ